MKKIWLLSGLVVVLVILALAGCAGNANKTAEDPRVADLSAKVDEVSKRADDIFNVQPKFAIPMREYGQRYGDMYYAAKGGNWALAGYMVKYMKGAMKPASITKPEEYNTLQSWQNTNLPPLVDAIEKKDFAAFDDAYGKIIDACNGCHDGMGYGYVDYKRPATPPDEDLTYTLKTEPTDFKDFADLKK